MSYKLSVIIPAFNVEKYIFSAIFSLGSWLNSDDVEIIVVDDGSSDRTKLEVDRAITNFRINNLKIYSRENAGLSESRNFGLSVSNGEYVYFFDSDDVLINNIDLKIMEVIKQQRPKLIGFGYENKNQVDGITSAHRLIEDNRSLVLLDTTDILEKLLLSPEDPVAGYVWTKVFKKSLIGDLSFRDMNYEDMPFFLEYISRLNNFKMVYINEIGYSYIQRGGSITHTPSEANLLDKLTGFEIAEELIPRIDDVNTNVITANFQREIIGYLWVASLNRTLGSEQIRNRVQNFLSKNFGNMISHKTTLYIKMKYLFYLFETKWQR
ncbi:glycosyltransferase family 2 protein [Weissella paramesenteroides]|uniref:glycosyltransferase family 2 protein n=1 Tax=Weissella paramesenteroides TaxID=1249 RepID=UPI00103DA475|nr:glycosyltransferase family A protein [Weissella paramesenteroides]RZQ57491.1 glycosyltransferase family 2 protein [Weissella paramesenteroides]